MVINVNLNYYTFYKVQNESDRGIEKISLAWCGASTNYNCVKFNNWIYYIINTRGIIAVIHGKYFCELVILGAYDNVKVVVFIILLSTLALMIKDDNHKIVKYMKGMNECEKK